MSPTKKMQIFKIKNRKGYAAICCHHLTEGKTPQQAAGRMQKAMRRVAKKYHPAFATCPAGEAGGDHACVPKRSTSACRHGL